MSKICVKQKWSGAMCKYTNDSKTKLLIMNIKKWNETSGLTNDPIGN